jgi:hypothetical protein
MAEKTTPNITIKEFRMWLEGVEEMQDEGWVPDPKQWARIRSKINSIEDAPLPKRNEAQVPQYNTYNPHEAAVGTGYIPEPFQIPTTVLGNPQGGGLPGMGNAPSFPGGIVTTKTPDIDTSAGGYVSKFG